MILAFLIAIFLGSLTICAHVVDRMDHHDELARRRMERQALGRAARRARDETP